MPSMFITVRDEGTVKKLPLVMRHSPIAQSKQRIDIFRFGCGVSNVDLGVILS